MSRWNEPWLYVTRDASRDVALVRGTEARKVVRMLVPGGGRWSTSMRGVVVPAQYVADVAAYGEAHWKLVVVHERREAA
jgi:hypothetical protein